MGTAPDRVGAEEVPKQPPRIGITHMVDPALHAGVQFGKGDLACAIVVDARSEAAAEGDHVTRSV